MMSAALRRALIEALERSALPAGGALAGGYAGATQSDNPIMGAAGGAAVGGLAGLGMRNTLRAVLPDLVPALRAARRDVSARDLRERSRQTAGRRVDRILDELGADMSPPLPRRRVSDVNPEMYGDHLSLTPEPMAPRAPDSRTVTQRMRMEDIRQNVHRGETPTTEEVIQAGLRGDEDGVTRGVPGSWLPSLHAPGRGDDVALFGGAPFDPARMRRAAGLSVNKRQAARPEVEARTEEDFLASLPDDPARWREVINTHPWINTPARAEMVIMANAMKPDGSFKYSTDDILARTGYSSATSLWVVLGRARRTPSRPDGVPIRRRNIGMGQPGGATAPPGGIKLNRIADILESSVKARAPLTNKEIARRLGMRPKAVDEALWHARQPPGHSEARVGASRKLRQRLKDLETERDLMLGTRRKRRYGDDLLSILLPYLVTGGAATAISSVASREAQRRAIHDALEQT